MYCSHCGGPVGRRATSCPSCGGSLGAPPADPNRKEPERSAKASRWRPHDEPKDEPAAGLKGKLMWLLGGDPPPDSPKKEATPAAEAQKPAVAKPKPVAEVKPRPIAEIKPEAEKPLPRPPEKPQDTCIDQDAASPADRPAPATRDVSPEESSLSVPTQKMTRDLTPVGRTAANYGIDVGQLKIPKHHHTLQVLDATGKWRDWGMISAQGLSVGRGKTSASIPALISLASRHFKLSYQENGLVIEDLGSLNGVYQKVMEPKLLVDKMRFRVGNYVLEYRDAETPPPVAQLRAEDSEEFCAKDLSALAYLDVVRPDGSMGVRVPIVRPEGLVLGRDPKESSLALPDPAVSTKHAEVKRQGGTGSPFLLCDLGSRNGTYVKLEGRSELKAGDVLLAGQVLFRIAVPPG